MVPHSDIITQLLVFRSFIPLNLKLSSLCLSSVLTTKICVPSKAWPPLQRMRECCFLKPIYNLGPICPPPRFPFFPGSSPAASPFSFLFHFLLSWVPQETLNAHCSHCSFLERNEHPVQRIACATHMEPWKDLAALAWLMAPTFPHEACAAVVKVKPQRVIICFHDPKTN